MKKYPGMVIEIGSHTDSRGSVKYNADLSQKRASSTRDFIIESGQSYGVDVLAKYTKDRIFFWAVYSFGKNNRWDGFNTYAPVFDRRHNLNLVGSYVMGKKKDMEFNIRWNLGSGLPFTPNAGNYQAETFANGVTSNYVTNNPSYITMMLGTFNSQRLPYYHRLDITFKKHFFHHLCRK